MISTYKHGNIVWTDLENPTAEEIRKISEKYTFDPLVANDLLTPTMRPHVDLHGDHIYLILHFPIVDSNISSDHRTRMHEVDFVIGRNYIITNRYSNLDSFFEFSKIFEVDSVLDKSQMSEHAGFVFFYLIKHLYHDLFNRLENLRGKLHDFEEKIFDGREREMVFKLSEINRQLINFKSALSMHEDVLKSFVIVGENFFGVEFKHYLKSILGEYLKVQSELRNVKEYLNELRETNDSLLTTKQNEIMKNLTVISFIVLPLSLVTALFQMNAKTTPIIGSEYDFLKIIGIMCITLIAAFSFLKYKRWF